MRKLASLAVLVCFLGGHVAEAQAVRVWKWGSFSGKPKKTATEKEFEEIDKELADAREEAVKARRESRKKEREVIRLEANGDHKKKAKVQAEVEELKASADKYEAMVEKLKELKAEIKGELKQERRDAIRDAREQGSD